MTDCEPELLLFTDEYGSPQDQAILEAEYERNPKPDKSARMGIVNRVTLGEKEVQVSRQVYDREERSEQRSFCGRARLTSVLFRYGSKIVAK